MFSLRSEFEESSESDDSDKDEKINLNFDYKKQVLNNCTDFDLKNIYLEPMIDFDISDITNTDIEYLNIDTYIGSKKYILLDCRKNNLNVILRDLESDLESNLESNLESDNIKYFITSKFIKNRILNH